MRFMTKTLELNQILELVAHYAKSETIRNQIIELEPSIDLEEIQKKLVETHDMVQLISRGGLLPFIQDYDIDDLLQYAKLNRIFTINQLLVIRLFLSMERDFFSYQREINRHKIALNSLEPYVGNLVSHQGLFGFINSKMDEEGIILDDATPELFKIRRDINKLDKQLQEKLNKLLNDYATLLNEHVIVIRNNRFCIPVKDTYKNRVKGIIHDVSSSKQTIYIEPEATRQITAQIEHLKVLEEQEILKVMIQMSEEINLNAQSLYNNLDLFLTLDFIASKAQYAKTMSCNLPQINREKRIVLVQAKHPLLDQKTAIPIDLRLDDQIRTLLITGPNTGGKTVALKTVGLLTLMMQSGLLVPAAESTELAIFDQVFADIGDEQSILQSLSTFSSHLTKIINMINHVEDNTLILLDELGSGTDPNEGVSLAMAILNKLKTYDIRMMVTTHYSELKSYAYEQLHMATASVAFDKKTLKPLYYLQMGTTGSSHAFLIAQRLGLNESVVNEAIKLYQGRQTDLAKIMEKLNDEMLSIEKEKEQLSEEKEKYKDEKEKYQHLREQLIKDQDKIIETIKNKEESKWNDLKEEAKKIILELQNKKSLSNPELAQLKFQLNQGLGQDNDLKIKDLLSVGDDVFILPYQQYGKVVAIKNDLYQVIFGQFDLSFKESDLRKDQPKKQKTEKVKRIKTITGTTPEKKAQFELDLRGFRFEEVKDEMDQAIDRALLSGLSTMRIIHGFGSGAVRKAVYDYLKSCPYIKTQRFGGEGEGLNGVTIITLK